MAIAMAISMQHGHAHAMNTTDGWMDGCYAMAITMQHGHAHAMDAMDGWMDGWMPCYGWMDGWMDE